MVEIMQEHTLHLNFALRSSAVQFNVPLDVSVT